MDPAERPGAGLGRDQREQLGPQAPHLVAVARVERLAEQVAGRRRQRPPGRRSRRRRGQTGGARPWRSGCSRGTPPLAAARPPGRRESRSARAAGRRAPGSPAAASPPATAAAARARARAPDCWSPASIASSNAARRLAWSASSGAGELARGAAGVERLARRLDQRGEMPAVPGARLAGVAPPACELVQREGADELEQLEAAVVGLAANQAGLEQLVELRRPPARRRPPPAPPAVKPPRNTAALRSACRAPGEQVIAPADRRLERLLAVGEVPQRVLADRQRLRRAGRRSAPG